MQRSEYIRSPKPGAFRAAIAGVVLAVAGAVVAAVAGAWWLAAANGAIGALAAYGAWLIAAQKRRWNEWNQLCAQRLQGGVWQELALHPDVQAAIAAARAGRAPNADGVVLLDPRDDT